ncbi:hypothetical protein BCR34DRAFT_607674 [Clohesyomyces aquaticus]|uniref:Uncharacterized protein n=1 Tax=Clohesyomyces aquaticus TaxID=1231657 RepID=A0A1Y1YED4_9PLEO|nr:hypothetical protein BCR34DRAFT_607674 [Clohesyomyces aquaticus]
MPSEKSPHSVSNLNPTHLPLSTTASTRDSAYPEVDPRHYEFLHYAYSIGDDAFPSTHKPYTPNPTDVVAAYYADGGGNSNIATPLMKNEGKRGESRRVLGSWWMMILYGLVIAVLAGLLGGFIGKGIQDKRYKNSVLKGQGQQQSDGAGAVEACRVTPPASSSSTSTSTLNPTASSKPPSSSSSPSTAASSIAPTATPASSIPPIPNTSCPSDSTRRSSLPSTTSHLSLSYTILCSTGWTDDDLYAVNVATPSDCIESCAFYNANLPSDSNSQTKKCVGGGFIPMWTNVTRAMDDMKLPYNCYLKSGEGGLKVNDRVIEVVGLCMEGACSSVVGG